jgi:hypothetical protein
MARGRRHVRGRRLPGGLGLPRPRTVVSLRRRTPHLDQTALRGSRSPGSPYSPAGHSISRHYLTRINWQSSGLLIRGLGVQVPRGAPVCCRTDLALCQFSTVSWRPFRDHVCSTFARQSGPSPTGHRGRCRTRPFRPAWCAVPAAASALSAPADGITQRDVRWNCAAMALRYPRGTSEVHARYLRLPTPEYRKDQFPAVPGRAQPPGDPQAHAAASSRTAGNYGGPRGPPDTGADCGNPHRTRRCLTYSRSSAPVAVTTVHGQNT